MATPSGGPQSPAASSPAAAGEEKRDGICR